MGSQKERRRQAASHEGMRWPPWGPAGFPASFTPTTIVTAVTATVDRTHSLLPEECGWVSLASEAWHGVGEVFPSFLKIIHSFIHFGGSVCGSDCLEPVPN